MLKDNCAILLVDDEALSRKLLGNRLRELPGVTVTDLPNGLSAREYLLEHVVDIVITDIRMPFVDGLELTAFINDLSPETPIVIISGYGEFEYAKKAIQYGVKDYLLKPVQLQNLEAVVKKCREEVRNTRERQLKKRYSEQEKLEAALNRVLKEKDPDHCPEELERLIAGQGTVVSIRPEEEEKGRWEEISLRYKNLLCGALQNQTILSLGHYKGEYRYLILDRKTGCSRVLKAVPEFLNRILLNRVQWTQLATVSSVRELMDLEASPRINESNLVIERACQFMKEHLGEPISRNMVAEHVYLSSSHFGHLFKQVKGMGYNAYLTQMRVEQAKKMLKKNMMVADVAAAVGYRDAKYFSEIFYQKTGCFPSDYKFLLSNGEIAQDEEP